jgi:CRISPR-associated protein Csb1
MTKATEDVVNQWANDQDQPVALHLKQKLVPVEGEGGIIFPPTYAGIGYNIDKLSDGTLVATIDSVGSQANRMEPIFKEPPYSDLVPQIEITYGNLPPVSIFDVGHRLGDAIIRCTELRDEVREAFESFQKGRDASPIAKLAPTSLVFGVWDSRESQAKLPRIVQSVIRAWDVDLLTRSAQYFPPVDYSAPLDKSDPESGFLDRKKKDEVETKAIEAAASGQQPKSDEAKRGYVAVPAVGAHGGVRVNGRIERTVSVNLVALRRLNGANEQALRQYILGLSLVAATAPLDPFLRQGCMLTLDPQFLGGWETVGRDGTRSEIELTHDFALNYAKNAEKKFVKGQVPSRVTFNKDFATDDLAEASKKKK